MLLELSQRIVAQANVVTPTFIFQNVDVVIGHGGRELVAGAGFEPAAFRL